MSNSFACQNCLHEVDGSLSACPECNCSGSIAPKNQVPFFATPHDYPKPELLYCERCNFKTIHHLTHCPNCNTAVNSFLLGPNATKLLTRKQGNNSEIIIGCVSLVLITIIGGVVLLMFGATAMGSSTNVEKFFIGLAVLGFFMLIALGFLLKGIIGRMISGR